MTRQTPPRNQHANLRYTSGIYGFGFSVKNRLHLDLHASGERTDPIEMRKTRVDAEANRLAGLGATITGPLSEEGLDHYAVALKDPEGNEFDIN